MKNKVVTYVRGHRELLKPGEPTLQDQANLIIERFERQEMSRRIKDGIARKKERMTYQDIKGRLKRYQYNVTKVRQPNAIKTRN